MYVPSSLTCPCSFLGLAIQLLHDKHTRVEESTYTVDQTGLLPRGQFGPGLSRKALFRAHLGECVDGLLDTGLLTLTLQERPELGLIRGRQVGRVHLGRGRGGGEGHGQDVWGVEEEIGEVE